MASNTNRRLWITIALTAVIVFGFGYIFINASDSGLQTQKVQKKEESKPNADKYQAAPDFTLMDINGNAVSLSDFEGKVVFLNFWATWCRPCRMEIPHFIELIDKYGDDFVVLGVAIDNREFEKVPPFMDNMGINYPVVLDTKGVSNMYGGIRSIPTTFVISREGKAVEMIVGSRPKDEFENLIKKWM